MVSEVKYGQPLTLNVVVMPGLGASIPDSQVRGAGEPVDRNRVPIPIPLFDTHSLQSPTSGQGKWFPLSHEETMRNELHF